MCCIHAYVVLLVHLLSSVLGPIFLYLMGYVIYFSHTCLWIHSQINEYHVKTGVVNGVE